MEAILRFLPQRGFAEGGFDEFDPLRAREFSQAFRAEEDVLRDARGKNHRLLEKHPDSRAQDIYVGARCADGFAAEPHFAGDAQSGSHVGEPVQRAQQRAFSRTGRADDAEDLAGSHGEGNLANERLRSGMNGESARFEDRRGGIGDGRWAAIRHSLLRAF